MKKFKKLFIAMLAVTLLCGFNYMQEAIYASNSNKALVEASFEEILNEEQSEADLKMHLTYDENKVSVNKIVHPNKEEVVKEEELLLSTTYHVTENKTYDFEVHYTNIVTLEEKQETFSYGMKTLTIKEEIKEEAKVEEVETLTPLTEKVEAPLEEVSNTLERSTRAATTFPKAGMVLWNNETKAALNPPGYSGVPTDEWGGSKLYWGVNGSTPMKWRILNTNETGFGVSTGGVLIMHDDVNQIGTEFVLFSDTTESNVYNTSNLASYIDGKFSTLLDTKEQGATLASSRSETNYKAPYKNWTDNISNKQWFAPTMRMVITESYGYPNADIANTPRTLGGSYWLSSGNSADNRQSGAINPFASIYAMNVHAPEVRVVSASQLNPESILFVSNANGGKATGIGQTLTTIPATASGEYKLTLKDPTQTVSVNLVLVNSSHLATIKYSKTGAGTKLSAIVTDSTGNNIISYGQLATIASGSLNNQSAKVQLPTDFFTNGYKLKVFTEIANGDKKTDYASELVETNATITKHSVNFNMNGGTPAVTEQIIVHENKVVKPADPTRAGHRFDGWYSDAGFTKAWNFDTDTVTADMTLHAKWVAKYAVRFNTDGGTILAEQTIEDGGKVKKPADPTKAGYRFDGWYSDTSFTKAWNFTTDTVTVNMTLYAKWVAQYTVGFNINGGTPTISEQVIEDGNKVEQPINPTKAGHRFEGWYSDAAFTTAWNFDTGAVTKHMTLYANWEPVVTNKAGFMYWNEDTKFHLNPPGYSGVPTDAWGGSKLYWGVNKDDPTNEKPMKWRILNTNESGFGQANGVLMMHDDVNQTGLRVAFNGSSNAGNVYNASNLEQQIDKRFTETLDIKEQGATLASSRSETKYISPYSSGVRWTDNLTDKEWFAPTMRMMNTERYGYPYMFGANTPRSLGNQFWLSSEFIADIDPGATVDLDGKLSNSGLIYSNYVIGATQLNPDSILFASNAVGGKVSGTVGQDALTAIPASASGEYKLTLKDTSQTVTVNKATHNSFSIANIKYTKTGTGTTLSAIITDSAGNNIISYGKVADISETPDATELTAKVKLPSDFFTNGYKLKVFTEIANGDKKTDYASEEVELSLVPAVEYAFRFNSNGGSKIAAQKIDAGEKAIKPADPTKAGYRFDGWYTDNTTFAKPWDFDADTVTANMDIYAKWSDLYHITFDANSGVGSMSEIEFIAGESMTLPVNTFTKESYTFAGWNTKADATGTSYPDEAMLNNLQGTNMTLYATWKVQGPSVYVDIPKGLSLIDDRANKTAVKEDSVTIVKNPLDALWYPKEDIHIRTNTDITLTSSEVSDVYEVEVYKADGSQYMDGSTPLAILNVKDDAKQSAAFTLKTPMTFSKQRGTYEGVMNFTIEFVQP